MGKSPEIDSCRRLASPRDSLKATDVRMDRARNARKKSFGHICIPKSTNPQESQHKKIYLAIGKKHSLIPGLKGSRKLADHYALLAAAVTWIKIRYGMAEDWKHAKARDGLSKRARSKRTSSRSRKDGRPPDTSHELVGRGHRHGSATKSTDSAHTVAPVQRSPS
ncbi:hypothetical protein B0H17DRAFT_1133736 [Mycena rosella]|uniref:Uncharacterized protein n=1 Tax=Mycena rosella TaxID=1033263 RepID=A0AAD7DHJ1_MYCRO|nr:hypothetical protein B0H17DRAFT_1133736 [Mycena rosella]